MTMVMVIVMAMGDDDGGGSDDGCVGGDCGGDDDGADYREYMCRRGAGPASDREGMKQSIRRRTRERELKI